jgi:hypothetical protein
MKSSPNFFTRSLAMAGLTVLAASPAWAVFPFAWDTNASSVVNAAHGSWTGNGAVQPNIHSATGVTIGGNLGTNAQIAVNDFSSGTFTINGLDGNIYAPGGVKSGDGRMLANPINATHTITLTGGTADIRLHNSSSTDGGANLFNSVGLTGFSAGVTSITWKTTFSSPIAGRMTDLTSRTTRPMGSGLALLNVGGHALGDFTVNMQYDQIYHDLGAGFVSGAPAGKAPLVNQGFGTPAPGSSSFTSNAFNNFNEFLLVRGYNVDGDAAYDADDAPKVYMREMTWTITPDAGKSFNASTIFVTSMDGEQYTGYALAIPEPTSLLLMAGSVVGGCLLRRRRA